MLAEGQLGTVDDVHHGDTAGQTQRGFQRVGEAPDVAPARDQAVDHYFDGVGVVPVEADRLGQVHDLAVDPGPAEALPGQVAEQLLVLPFATPDDGRQHLETGAFVQLGDLVDDLLRGLASHHLPALRTVGCPDPGVEEAEVVVYLGDGPDSGAGIPAGGLLVDRYGRRQTFDEVHVGFVHLSQELAGVGREAFHVAPLALGVDGVERQAGLPRPGQPREDDEPVTGKLYGDVLQVVLACATNDQSVSCHRPKRSLRG